MQTDSSSDTLHEVALTWVSAPRERGAPAGNQPRGTLTNFFHQEFHRLIRCTWWRFSQ